MSVRSEEATAFLESGDWKAMVRIKRQSVGNKCEVCGGSQRLEVHHLTYERFGGKELLSDLQVLCRRCHSKKHGMQTLTAQLDKRRRDLCETLIITAMRNSDEK